MVLFAGVQAGVCCVRAGERQGLMVVTILWCLLLAQGLLSPTVHFRANPMAPSKKFTIFPKRCWACCCCCSQQGMRRQVDQLFLHHVSHCVSMGHVY